MAIHPLLNHKGLPESLDPCVQILQVEEVHQSAGFHRKPRLQAHPHWNHPCLRHLRHLPGRQADIPTSDACQMTAACCSKIAHRGLGASRWMDAVLRLQVALHCLALDTYFKSHKLISKDKHRVYDLWTTHPAVIYRLHGKCHGRLQPPRHLQHIHPAPSLTDLSRLRPHQHPTVDFRGHSHSLARGLQVEAQFRSLDDDQIRQ